MPGLRALLDAVLLCAHCPDAMLCLDKGNILASFPKPLLTHARWTMELIFFPIPSR